MNANKDTHLLIGNIDKGLARLNDLSAYYEKFKADAGKFPDSRSYDLIILADIITDFYTCVETVFFRIAQHFENCLEKERWHSSLLDRMAIDIPDVRPKVIDDATQDCLRDILKFRHFKRYYFQYDYDRERMEFLEKRFLRTLPSVDTALRGFRNFINAANT